VSQQPRQEVNWEFLLSSSKSTLQAYEQSRLNFATNVRKEIAQLLQVWVDESSNALLARWLIERNIAADSETIRANAGSGSSVPSGLPSHQAQVACGPGSASKPPSRVTASAAASAHNASGKIFGEKPLTSSRFHSAF
jgi:hypothetical protein